MDNHESFMKSITPLLIGVVVMWFGFEWGKSMNTGAYNPRSAIKGIDTIYYKDSVYQVRITIDSVSYYEEEKMGEPAERN